MTAALTARTCCSKRLTGANAVACGEPPLGVTTRSPPPKKKFLRVTWLFVPCTSMRDDGSLPTPVEVVTTKVPPPPPPGARTRVQWSSAARPKMRLDSVLDSRRSGTCPVKKPTMSSRCVPTQSMANPPPCAVDASMRPRSVGQSRAGPCQNKNCTCKKRMSPRRPSKMCRRSVCRLGLYLLWYPTDATCSERSKTTFGREHVRRPLPPP
mmetsp:Transcript_3256/g.7908  ORF Transcript_3256/g.7908 Transcript_3256/m.7908 type:complete len:210 (+) Transcript_3256:452-1081(+)